MGVHIPKSRGEGEPHKNASLSILWNNSEVRKKKDFHEPQLLKNYLKSKQEKQTISSKKWLLFMKENAVYIPEFGSFTRESERAGRLREVLVEISGNSVRKLSVSELETALIRDVIIFFFFSDLTREDSTRGEHYRKSFTPFHIYNHKIAHSTDAGFCPQLTNRSQCQNIRPVSFHILPLPISYLHCSNM